MFANIQFIKLRAVFKHLVAAALANQLCRSSDLIFLLSMQLWSSLD